MLVKTITTSTTNSMEKRLSRLTFIFQLVGIQYISPETLGATKMTKKQKIILVANVTLVIVELCAIAFAIYLEKSLHQHQSNVATEQIVQFTSYSLMIVVLLITILNSLLLRGKAKQIFNNCKNVSKIIFTLNQSVTCTAFENECKKTFAKLSLSFIGSTVVTLILIYQFNQKNVFLWAVLAVYPYFFLIIAFSYWTLLIRLIRENLRFIKESLVHLHNKIKLFPNHSETYNHDYRLKRNHETYNFIVKLKRIYGVVYETTSLVNEVIAVPVGLFIILIVIANVSSGYKVFLSFRKDVPVERVGVPIYTIFISIISLCTLIFSCCSTYDTIDDILTQVHKFECSQFDRESEISTILLEFSLQIVQRPIEFMVGGFYCLTQPFLATIVTGVMTYVLLLVQFSKS